jgi:hypothetical protein
MHRSSAVFAAITLLACSESTSPVAPVEARAIGLAITPLSLNLTVNDQARFSARAFDARDRTVSAPFKWSSADPTIATVGKN